jgi:3-oxoadipate enol-lactonase/3-oxoadipate enol-lactonase/4-carboxymuconolactone decarboxylase
MAGGDPAGSVPGLDEPRGYLVTVGEVDRIHFLDWGDPPPVAVRDDADAGPAEASPILLIHGIAATAWTWLPVARRLRSRHHVVAQDLRGHGLSDAPPFGYRPDDLAEDALAVAEGAGLLGPGARLVVAGHGFGGLVAAWLARRLGDRCAGLVLVDGGWEAADATGLEPEELLRALEEPPEVLRSMAAWLADRAAFDPPTWDADQEQAARAAVVELPAGRVVLAARPHVLAGCVEAMYEHDPADVLSGVRAPIVALAAGGEGSAARLDALAAVDRAIRRDGRSGVQVFKLPDAGHNLMRYRPDAVAEAIATAGATARAYHRGS